MHHFARAVFFGVLFYLAAATSSQAQATRTWVSGVGDDANPCSRTAPCKTFAGAISKTATGGEINCLDPGGFGTVTITKSITIDCHEAFGSILNVGTNGISIAFDSFQATDNRKTVNLRNLIVQGAGSGNIGVQIFGVGTGSFVDIEDSLINGDFSSTAAGIIDQRTNGTLFVANTTVRNMGDKGISTASSGGGSIRTTLTGVKVVNSNQGIAVGPGAAVQISSSVIASNSTAGFAIIGGALSINGCTVAHNGIGIQQTGGIVNLSDSDFSYNVVGISGSVNSFTNNRFTINGEGGTIVPIGTTSNPTGLQ